MATKDYWAEAPMDRSQIALFSPTLDSMIAEDDSVREFDRVMGSVDWSEWEAQYNGTIGQPAVHPKHQAACLIYGMIQGMRSSRKLEEACNYRLDFMWLLHGRKFDHSTLCTFRTRFAGPLKDLFRQVGRMAMNMGLIDLIEVAFDGTRVKASNNRYGTRTAKKLEERLAVLDELYDAIAAEFDANDAGMKTQKQLENEDGPPDESPPNLPKELADVEKKRQKVREALDQAQAADEARRKQRVNPEKNPAQVPMTDPDSRVMPNKEGGYAPNYTPTATTDGRCGFIVDCEVTADVNESDLTVPSVDRIEKTFGQKPENFLTDGGNNSGHIIQEMEQRGVEFYAPVDSSQPQEGNPAKRDDPTVPVADSDRERLPKNNYGQFAKSCFVYDAETDVFYCPQGKELPFEKTKPDVRDGGRITKRIYRCEECAACQWKENCLASTNKHGRTITRDEYDETRERLATRMATDEARKRYKQRPRIAETPFGIMKSIMGIRQFLTRRLPNVQTEWRWAATAFNIAKLVREIERLRAECSTLAIQTEG